MRRVQAVDLMLFGTVLLWALNSTVTRYVLTHGFQPLAYATIRYAAATALFWVFTYSREGASGSALRDLRSSRSPPSRSSSTSSASSTRSTRPRRATVTLFLGATPIFIGVVASVIGLERLGRGFWVATPSRSSASASSRQAPAASPGTSWRQPRASLTAATWGAYTVAVTPLMRRYSPFRISSLVLLIGWIPLAITERSRLASQNFRLRLR